MAVLVVNSFRIMNIVALYWIQVAGVCFPDGFKFGVASSAHQIEGAWNVSGKGENIWDRLAHTHPEEIVDGLSGDVAADSYHHWRHDVALLSKLAVHYYRFSISWSRILPNGLSNHVNPDGLRYYSGLLDELLRHRIRPLVTMYHWDLPQCLQDLGGWTNPVLAEYFVDYARVLFDNFGDRVKYWVTFNEPLWFCRDGYGGAAAPAHYASGHQDYLCGHTVLRAHAMVYRVYSKEYRKKQNGTVGIILDLAWKEPPSDTIADQVAAETARQFLFGWFAHPIMSTQGDYPPIMRKRIDEISKLQRFGRSRLPKFTKREVKMIRGSYDFLGFNHYATYLLHEGNGRIFEQPNFYADMGTKLLRHNEFPKTNSSWLKIIPSGLRSCLNWIKTNFNNPLVIVTESGMPTFEGVHDFERVEYLRASLNALHDAVVKDDCNVVGYTYWSFMDNFEWLRGYSVRFGLFEVDFASPEKTRTPRLSAAYFSRAARTNCIPN